MRLPYLAWRLTPEGRAAYRAYAEHARQGPWAAPAPARVPAYYSRKARRLRADAALERARTMPRMVPAQVTDIWSDGRKRVTDYDTRTGRKTRVHETRPRARDRDGQWPGQRRSPRAARRGR